MARSQQMFTQPGQMYAPDTQRKLAMAQALRSQGLQMPQGTSMGSGAMQRFAAPHWSQYVGNLAQNLSGAYMEHKAEQTNQDRMSELVQALRGADSPEYVMQPGYEQPSQMDRLAALEDNPLAQQYMLSGAMQGGAEPDWQKVEMNTGQGVQTGFVDMNSSQPEATFRPLGEAVAEEPDMTSAMQEYQFAQQQGFPGSFMDYQTQKAQAGASSTNVNLPGDDPLAGFTETSIGTLTERAQTAPQRQSDAEMGLNMLKKRIQTGNETGKWAPMKTEMSAWLGLNPDEVATAQAFDVKMGDKVMGRIQETKGAVSEREMDYFSKISPGSDKEPFTNYILLEIDRRAAAREQDKLRYVEDYINQNGNLLGFDQWYMQNKDPFPQFDVDQLKQEYQQWAQDVPTAQTPAPGWSIERVE